LQVLLSNICITDQDVPYYDDPRYTVCNKIKVLH